MRYYVEEISILTDGTSAHAIREKESKDNALSDFHSAMAYAYLNPDVVTFHCEAKDEIGMQYANDTINRSVLEEDEETIE